MGVTNLTEDVNKLGSKSLLTGRRIQNGKMVSSSSNTYAYPAYIKTLLTFVVLCGTGTRQDIWTPYESACTTKQGSLPAEEKKVDMNGYIHDDVFRQTTLLPPGITVKVRFVRVTEQFSLTSTKAEYKTDIFSAVLYVKKCKV